MARIPGFLKVTNAPNAAPKLSAETTSYSPQSTTVPTSPIYNAAMAVLNNGDKDKNDVGLPTLTQPMFDNKLRHYEAAGLFPARVSNRLIVFVNGMNSDPHDHQRGAMMLSTIADDYVLGIYNRTGIDGRKAGCHEENFLIDVMQCAHDQMLPVGSSRFAANPVGWLEGKLVRKMSQPNPILQLRGTALRKVQRSIRQNVEAQLIANNATKALFNVLYDCAENNQKVIVVCHSQGNLITANALWALKSARESFTLPTMGSILVLGLASPAASWPDNAGKHGLRIQLFRDNRDPITLLARLGQNKKAFAVHRGNGWNMDAHDVDSYLLWRPFQIALAHALRA